VKKIEELANKLLQGRGYLVIGHDSKHHVLPFVIACADSPFGELDHPLALVVETDEADWKRQAEFLGLNAGICHEYYYRALAE
jgi:hypothetical protein